MPKKIFAALIASVLTAFLLTQNIFTVSAVNWLWPESSSEDYSDVYDFEYYVNRYSDVREKYADDPRGALMHFLDTGMRQGRQASEDFNVMVYRRRYPSVLERYGTDLRACYQDYIRYGKEMGASGAPDGVYTSTQLSELRKIGNLAYKGDEEAQEDILAFLGNACDYEWKHYGFLPSVLIAQIIYETGWCSDEGSFLKASDNNILGMNLCLISWKWKSPWTGRYAWRTVPQFDEQNREYHTYETMRRYADVEECIEDYAAFKIGLHPELAGLRCPEVVIRKGLRGFSTDQTYYEKIRSLIRRYQLVRFDI